MVERMRKLSGVSFLRGLIPLMINLSSWSNYLPKFLYKNTITLGIKIEHEFWEYTNIQTIAGILSIMNLNTMCSPLSLSHEPPIHVSDCLLSISTWMSLKGISNLTRLKLNCIWCFPHLLLWYIFLNSGHIASIILFAQARTHGIILDSSSFSFSLDSQFVSRSFWLYL